MHANNRISAIILNASNVDWSTEEEYTSNTLTQEEEKEVEKESK